MFNTKLKKQIESLEDRIWKLENPPKYKVGDKIDKEWIVTKIYYCNYGFTNKWSNYDFEVVNIKTGETKTI